MFSTKTKTITNTKQTDKRKTIRREQIHADIKVQNILTDSLQSIFKLHPCRGSLPRSRFLISRNAPPKKRLRGRLLQGLPLKFQECCYDQWRDPGEGYSLTFTPNWGPKGRKSFLETPAPPPPPLSSGSGWQGPSLMRTSESATDDAISRREAELLESTFAVFSLCFLCTK